MHPGFDFTGITVVFACHDGEGNFLFSKRSANARDEHGRWDIGAGAMELGSSPEETLAKEIKEEYLTEVVEFEFLGYRNVLRLPDGIPSHWLTLDFKVLVDRSLVGNGEPHKSDRIEWFTLDALPHPMHSQWPMFLGKYRAKLLA